MVRDPRQTLSARFGRRAWTTLSSRRVRRTLSALFFAGAVVLIWRQLSAIRPGDLMGAILGASPLTLAASLLLTALSYLCLSVTEWLSLRALGRRLALRDAVAVAVPAYALTNSAGFSPITGAAFRLQAYGHRGLSAKQAAEVAFVAGAAVTLSGLVMLGVTLAIDPATAAASAHGPRWAPQVLAVLLLAPALAWFAAFRPGNPRWLGGGQSHLTWSARLLGLAAGLGDWLFSGLAFFVLLPSPQPATAPAFLAAYVAGSLLSAATGVPGGLGVFEAIVIALTAVFSRVHETAAALILYRSIYSLLPLTGVGVVFLARRIATTARRRRSQHGASP